MLETFWQEIQERLFEQSYFEKWEARLIQTKWKNLIFARPFDYDFKLLTIFWIETCIKNALKICEEHWFENISITALSGNYLPENENQINEISKLALGEYFQKYPKSAVKEVFLINYEKKVFR